MVAILFLDDEEHILSTYKRMIHSHQVDGYFAKNSKEAIGIMKKYKIDLIISDYRLEQETGLDFLKSVRQEDEKIPMVIISGFADEKFIENAMELGVIQKYLVKPVSLDRFKKLLGEFFSKEVL